MTLLTFLGTLYPFSTGTVTHLLFDVGVKVGLAVVEGVGTSCTDVVARTLVTAYWVLTAH